jgi:hypothetical protein
MTRRPPLRGVRSSTGARMRPPRPQAINVRLAPRCNRVSRLFKVPKGGEFAKGPF